jgi:membrane-bound lytic murein transglycosylase B
LRFLSILFILLFSNFAYANPQPFDIWLKEFKQEAVNNGIDADLLNQAFAGFNAPSKKIVELDRKQPEKVKTFDEYVAGVVTQGRINDARIKWKENLAILQSVEQKYGVPASTILALWAIESNFGNNQGDFSVVKSLAALAYDGRRSKFFRKELLNAFKIIQSEGMSPSELTGSWAGAMGQTQFMPSSFLSLAVDFDGDGKKDIWNNNADALASIANYLKTRGWNSGIGFGVKVELPEGFDLENWRKNKSKKPLRDWQAMRIVIDGDVDLSLPARIIIPDGYEKEAFLVFSNYDVIMDWNRSIYFATSVWLLSDAIAGK